MDYIAKRKPSKLNKALAVTPFIYAIIFLSILIPNINNGVEIGAVIGYAIMIAIMGASALMLDIKHKWWYVLAAALFIYSDSVIVYNKYIERIPNASMLIMTTYYAAQGLFASLHLLRRKE
jgi:alkenylglycerophosphocholine/alkenylglycerophosphoethanolamine hydrolase